MSTPDREKNILIGPGSQHWQYLDDQIVRRMLRDCQKRFPESFPSRGAPTPLCTPRGLGLSGSMQVRINRFVCAKYRYRYGTVLYVPTVRSFCWYKKCLNLFTGYLAWVKYYRAKRFFNQLPLQCARTSVSQCLAPTVTQLAWTHSYSYVVVDPDPGGPGSEINLKIWIWKTDKIVQFFNKNAQLKIKNSFFYPQNNP